MALIDTITKSASHENSRVGNLLPMPPPLSIPAADIDPAVVILDNSLEENSPLATQGRSAKQISPGRSLLEKG